MRTMKAIYGLITAFSLLINVGHANAEFYFGGSAGTTQNRYDNVQDGISYKISGGYKFNSNVVVDVSYLKIGEMDIDTNNTPLHGKKVYLSFDGMSYSVAHYVRLGNAKRWYATGRIGIYEINSARKGYQDRSARSTGVCWGVGVDYAILKHLWLGADFESYVNVKDFSNNDTLVLILGSVAYHF